MNSLFCSCIVISVLFVGCSTPKRISDTLIDYEAAGHPKDAIRNAYTMRDLVCALDNRFWELPPAGRSPWLDANYPGGVPEDFISLPESGAQVALSAIRLDKDVLAIVSNSQLVDGSSELRVLRRTPGGWTELTRRAFPYRYGSGARLEAQRDRSVIVRHRDSGTLQRYVWRGSKFVSS
jgi:hypothetical protein